MAGALMERIISGTILGILLVGMFVAVWDIAYAKAKKELAGEWYQGAEGYCLAENHPGACK